MQGGDVILCCDAELGLAIHIDVRDEDSALQTFEGVHQALGLQHAAVLLKVHRLDLVRADAEAPQAEGERASSVEQ